jgi:hypothetical protein
MLLFDLPDLNIFKVGRRTLTPPDPQLKGAWYPGGFNPCIYQVKNRFQNVPLKFNLHRCIEERVRIDIAELPMTVQEMLVYATRNERE